LLTVCHIIFCTAVQKQATVRTNSKPKSKSKALLPAARFVDHRSDMKQEIATVTYMARERASKRDTAREIEEEVGSEIAIETGRATTDGERDKQERHKQEKHKKHKKQEKQEKLEKCMTEMQVTVTKRQSKPQVIGTERQREKSDSSRETRERIPTNREKQQTETSDRQRQAAQCSKPHIATSSTERQACKKDKQQQEISNRERDK